MSTDINLSQGPVDNGSTGQQPSDLPRRPRVVQVLDVLRRDYGVPHDLCEQLGDAFSQAAKQVVDDVVAGRQQPAIAAYYIARRLDGPVWWQT
jgi:hypothetical protein